MLNVRVSQASKFDDILVDVLQRLLHPLHASSHGIVIGPSLGRMPDQMLCHYIKDGHTHDVLHGRCFCFSAPPSSANAGSTVDCAVGVKDKRIPQREALSPYARRKYKTRAGR